MIIVVSNRNVAPDRTDETIFSDQPNERSLDELRVAIASYNSGTRDWRVELLPEANPTDQINPPSRVLFYQVMEDIDAGKLTRDWVFFIHGFNQSFRGSLEFSRQLEEKYRVNVIVFSWPSNQGGFIADEYRDARQAAKASSMALDRTLEKLGRYMHERGVAMLQRRYELQRSPTVDPNTLPDCRISLNFMAHSLGNYLFECFIRTPIFGGETKIFDNVILHQADVDISNHAEWVNKINSKRVYATINERDSVLKASNFVNTARLGNTAEKLNARRSIYMDFTDTRGIGNSHNIFLDVRNSTVTDFCQSVITGGRGELVDRFKYDAHTNTYRVDDR